MEQTKTDQFQQKSPEELATQLDVINLERHMLGQEALAPTAVAPDDPQHREYVGSLRQLRKSQTAFLQEHQHVMKASEVGLQFGEFWRSRDFSPLGWAALYEINNPYRDTNELSVTQRKAAVQSVNMIVSMADKLVEKSSSNLYHALPRLETIWGSQKTVQRVERDLEVHPLNAMYNVKRIATYFGEEKSSELIQSAVDKIIESGFNAGNISVLVDPEERKLLKPEQVGALAKLILSEPDSFELDREYGRDDQVSKALKLKEAGLITDKDIARSIIDILDSDHSLASYNMTGTSFSASLGTYMPMLEQEGLASHAKELVEARIKEGQLAGELADITIIPDDEKRELIQSVIDSYPEQLLGLNIRSTIAVLGSEETKSLLFKQIGKLDNGTIERVLSFSPDNFLSKEDKKLLIGITLKDNPARIFDLASKVIDSYGHEGAQKMFRQAYKDGLLDDPRSRALSSASEWLPYLSDDPEKLKAIFLDQVSKNDDNAFLSKYYGPNFDLRDMFSLEELRDMVASRLFNPEFDAVTDFYTMEQEAREIIEIFGEKQLIAWTKQAIESKPALAASLLNQSFHLMEKAELASITQEIIDLDPMALLEKPILVANALGAEAVNSLVEKAIELNPQQAVINLRDLYVDGHIDEAAYNQYVQDLIVINPAFMCAVGGFNVNEKNLISIMQKQTDIGEIAPEWFKNYSEIYKKSSISTREKLVNEAQVLFNNLHLIRQKAPHLLTMISKLNGDPTAQANNIAKLAFLSKAELLESITGSEIEFDQNAFDELVYAGLEKMIGRELPPEARKNAESSINSLITYLSGIDNSESHNKIIADLISCTSPEEFRDYRLIADSEQALIEAREAGLLPVKLTTKQHRVWREDLVVNRHENVNASAEEVIESLREIIAVNEEEFELSQSVDLTPEQRSDLKTEIGKLGGRLAELHKVLGDKDQPEDVIQETKELVAQVRSELKLRQTLVALNDLYTLTTDELIQGGKLADDGKKTTSIDTILERALKLASQRELTEEAGLAIRHIGGVIYTFNEQTGGAKDLSITDTIDLNTTMEIGANPVVTCQNYVFGQYRSALLGYTDPNTKMIVIREAGNIMARAVVRLLEDENGEPSLHVETIYTQSPSKIVSESIYGLAFEKAQKMGIPVYVTKVGIGRKDTSHAELPFNFEETSKILATRAIRAPRVYVDSAYGSKSSAYKIQNLRQISPKR